MGPIPARRLGHFYSAFLQIWTQDASAQIAGEEGLLYRWLFPPTLWRAGEHIPVSYNLQLPPDLAPGAYRLVTGVYIAHFTDRRLTTAPDDWPIDDAATIGWLKVPLPPTDVPADALAFDATIDDAFALRAGSACAVRDTSLEITLYWQALTDRPRIDATIFIHALAGDGTLLTGTDARPLDGQYPTFIWDAGEIVRTTHTLDASGAAALAAGMYTFPGSARLPVMQNGSESAMMTVDLSALLD
ncbi:MAG: hypothetical protein HC828_15545, partial [Blastochloris sp.]|nr:hypothetical protein [Blastochloris sp.]